MIERKRILLIGAGAIGSVYAAALSKSNNEFAIAADPDRITKYLNEGIYFCDERIEAPFIFPDKSYGIADIILITVKNYSLTEALEVISPAVGEETVIIPLLNGLTSEQITSNRFSPENVLYGYYIGHTSTRNGNKIVQDGNYMTVIGDFPSSSSSFSKKLVSTIKTLSNSGIKVEGHYDMKTEIWKKFVINVCLNQSTAYFNCTYGEILGCEEKLSLFRNLAYEVQLVAEKEKIKDASTFADYVYDILLKMDPNDRSSMAQDVLYGRRTEVADFAGEIIKLSDKHGIKCPTNEMIYTHFL